MSLEVLGHRVLCKPAAELEEVTESGLVIAKEAVKRENMATQKGTVIQIGPLAFRTWDPDNQRFVGDPWVDIGDIVYWPKYAGKIFDDPETGDPVYILNDEDVYMRVKKNG